VRRRAARLAALASGLLFIALASTAAAATANVEIAGFAFDPPTLTINAGDTVTWTNRDGAQHSVVFAGGGPRTRVLSNGQSDSLTFTVAGTFNYVCGIHGASMSGTIIVRAAATAPPTLAPTPVPTARPTIAPTVAPTVAPTIEPTPSPSPSVTASAAPTTAAPTPTPSVAAAAPTEQAAPPAASDQGGGPSPLLVGGALVAVIALVSFALTRVRR
jgi:plastocyanin